MLRIIKTLLIFSVFLWGIFGAFGNLTDWNGTIGAVEAVASMSTFEGGAESWRATTNPVLILAGALFIILSKVTAGILCLIGGGRMWSARKADAAAFNHAKTFALSGCGVAIFMLFLGFIVIGEGWFELWRSDVFRDLAGQSAFRYAGMIGIVAIFVSMADD
ncbi:DUF2165 domain-containing protein [Litorimonas sp.]|uniref:DUF2165 domain-containing protein n=1 Tax=Litorimonas sp. TaxID=1892381 RepID=UPI003A8ABA2C